MSEPGDDGTVHIHTGFTFQDYCTFDAVMRHMRLNTEG